MTGYVGITDFKWYSFLASKPGLREINFWQPKPTNLLKQRTGIPFFFKLKAAHGSWIAGFAYFAWRTTMPAWMAWDSFGEANGASSKREMLAEIGALRRDEAVDRTGRYEIGCLILAEPVFLPQSAWVKGPSDWSSGIQRGKFYELNEGEGSRIYTECLARTGDRGGLVLDAVVSGGPAPQPIARERFGTPTTIRPRLGQGGFRAAITDVYARACAISGEHSLPALEAAHIRPYGEGGTHEIRNGLLLRADLHRLFDGGFVTVTPEHEFRVSRRLREEYENGRVYYELEEQIRAQGGIRLPARPEDRPDPKLLEWHSTSVFER
ncbi:MAG: HNH endonuclease [Candidatus Eisenbacteria bacterium]|nr:HNH endonuclease [Candidatus Eisenbacteria bacterium]